MQVNYPFRIDASGRTARTSEADHVRQMIEQVLFTSPGERVNRPDFGTGLMQLVFAPNSPEVATATEFMIQGALQQWLGEIIQVDAVSVESDDSQLHITIQYRLRNSEQPQTARFTQEV